MEVTEAPSVHRATELVCHFYQHFIYKAFIPKQLSRICTLHLRRSLCRRHLRDIAFTSVPTVTSCAYYIDFQFITPYFGRTFSYRTYALNFPYIITSKTPLRTPKTAFLSVFVTNSISNYCRLVMQKVLNQTPKGR